MKKDYIFRITFLDKDGEAIGSYNPGGHSKKCEEIHAIGDKEELIKEELIGVYGVRNKNPSYFTSFGFIAMIR